MGRDERHQHGQSLRGRRRGPDAGGEPAHRRADRRHHQADAQPLPGADFTWRDDAGSGAIDPSLPRAGQVDALPKGRHEDRASSSPDKGDCLLLTASETTASWSTEASGSYSQSCRPRPRPIPREQAEARPGLRLPHRPRPHLGHRPAVRRPRRLARVQVPTRLRQRWLPGSERRPQATGSRRGSGTTRSAKSCGHRPRPIEDGPAHQPCSRRQPVLSSSPSSDLATSTNGDATPSNFATASARAAGHSGERRVRWSTWRPSPRQK